MFSALLKFWKTKLCNIEGNCERHILYNSEPNGTIRLEDTRLYHWFSQGVSIRLLTLVSRYVSFLYPVSIFAKMSTVSVSESEDYVEEYTSEHSDIFVSSFQDDFQTTIEMLDMDVDEVDNAVLNSLEEVHAGYNFLPYILDNQSPFNFK